MTKVYTDKDTDDKVFRDTDVVHTNCEDEHVGDRLMSDHVMKEETRIIRETLEKKFEDSYDDNTESFPSFVLNLILFGVPTFMFFFFFLDMGIIFSIVASYFTTAFFKKFLGSGFR